MGKHTLEINDYFYTCQKYGSLFILSDKRNSNRIVAEIKQINDGQDQLSFIPLSDEEHFDFEVGEEVQFINEASNISFTCFASAIHNKSWLTVKYPESLKIVNLRSSERFNLEEKHLSGASRLISFGEEGVSPLMNHQGRVLDISDNGASFEINASSLDGYYKGDYVEVMVTENFPFLTQVKGRVVHKAIGNMMDKENRTYHIGIKFNKKINLSPLGFSS